MIKISDHKIRTSKTEAKAMARKGIRILLLFKNLKKLMLEGLQMVMSFTEKESPMNPSLVL